VLVILRSTSRCKCAL